MKSQFFRVHDILINLALVYSIDYSEDDEVTVNFENGEYYCFEITPQEFQTKLDGVLAAS